MNVIYNLQKRTVLAGKKIRDINSVFLRTEGVRGEEEQMRRRKTERVDRRRERARSRGKRGGGGAGGGGRGRSYNRQSGLNFRFIKALTSGCHPNLLFPQHQRKRSDRFAHNAAHMRKEREKQRQKQTWTVSHIMIHVKKRENETETELDSLLHNGSYII